MNRRDFFNAGAVLGAGLLVSESLASRVSAQTTAETDQRAAAKFRLSCQLGLVPGDSDEAKMDLMKKWGCEAVELSGDVVEKADAYRKAAENAGLAVSAICWGSHGGDLVSPDESKRRQGMDDFKRVLEAAGKVGARGVIHVPAFDRETTLSNKEVRNRCLEYLPVLGEFAKANQTTVILEPLCRYEAFFLRQVADGASICRDCGGPDCGVTVMGDFYHMDSEETSNMGAFISAGNYLNHVHIASGRAEPCRVLPGQNSMLFVDGFRGLKYIGYTGFCSFECGCQGDPLVEFPKSIAFLHDQWNLA